MLKAFILLLSGLGLVAQSSTADIRDAVGQGERLPLQDPGLLRTEVPDGAKGIEGYNLADAPYRAFSIEVPAKSSLHVRLHHVKEAWIRLGMTNQVGWQEPGMARNFLKTGNPEVFYRNDKAVPVRVLVYVYDPTPVSSPAETYKLELLRSKLER